MDKWGYSYLIELKTLWEKEINCYNPISPFPTMFSTGVCCWCIKMSMYGVKRVKEVRDASVYFTATDVPGRDFHTNLIS